MQKITREALIEKASALLSEGKVNRVLGWKKGEFSYFRSRACAVSAKGISAPCMARRLIS